MKKFLLLSLVFSACECRCELTTTNAPPPAFADDAYYPGPGYYLLFYVDPNLQEQGLIRDGARTCVVYPWRIHIAGRSIYGPPRPCEPGQTVFEGQWDTQSFACHVPPSHLDDPAQCFGAPLPPLIDARYLVPPDAG